MMVVGTGARAVAHFYGPELIVFNSNLPRSSASCTVPRSAVTLEAETWVPRVVNLPVHRLFQGWTASSGVISVFKFLVCSVVRKKRSVKKPVL